MIQNLSLSRRTILPIIFSVLVFTLSAATPVTHINYHYENGSPLFYDVLEDGSVLISLVYDHERDSPNRANGHWNFQVFAEKGARVKLILQNFENVWNGRESYPVKDNTPSYLSVDGEHWDVIQTNLTPEHRIEIEFDMPADSVYVARLEPYRVSDLEELLADIKDHPLVKVTEIGKTVEGRSLEIVRVGHVNAPHRIFIRGRAHAWEPGGSWVIEGLIRNLIKGNAQTTKYLSKYCVYILPMINKDRVFHGGTRFNLNGKDLNRNWDKPADPYLVPENAALEKWLGSQIELGLKPDLAFDLHNDDNGKLHISRPNVSLDTYLKNMAYFEALLRKHTWFTEGSTGSNFRNPGSIGEGLLERYGIDAFVYELNANWIEGLKKEPFGKDWMLLGEQLGEVFYQYFSR